MGKTPGFIATGREPISRFRSDASDVATARILIVSMLSASRDITVNALLPGYTDTDLMPPRDRKVAASASPFNRVGQPVDVADAAAFLASDDARWVTAQELGAGGGVF